MLLSSFDSFRVQILALSVLSSAGVLFGSVKLHGELNRREGPGTGEVIARVQEFSGIVQRKRARRYSWSRVLVGDGYYHRESLQTGESSQVELLLSSDKANIKLKVEENSLVVFNSESEFGLEVIDGAIEVLKEDQTYHIFKQRDQLKRIRVSVALESPSLGAEFFTKRDEKTSVKMKWSLKKGSMSPTSNTVLELSDNPEFIGSPIYSKNIYLQKETIIDLGSGHYYWKLSNTKETLSRTGQFKVTEVRPLNLLSIQSKTPGTADFYWRAPNYLLKKETGEHFIQIALDASFKNRVREHKISPSQQFSTINEEDERLLFTRLKSIYPSFSVFSDKASFKMKDGNISNISFLNQNKPKQIAKLSQVKNQIKKEPAPEETQVEIITEEVDLVKLTQEEIKIENTISNINDDDNRFPLSIKEQKENLLFSWEYPVSKLIKSWEIWRVEENGKLVTLLASKIDKSAREAYLSFDEIKEGTLLAVIGNLPDEKYITSTIAKYSRKAPLPLASINIQESMRIEKGGFIDTNKIHATWKSAGTADYYVMRLFQGDKILHSKVVSPHLREVIINYKLDVYDPNIKVDIRAVRAKRYSSPISDKVCLADVNKDNQVNHLDSEYLEENQKNEVKYIFSNSNIEVGGIGDVSVNGVIDEDDLLVVKYFTGKDCF